MSAAEPVFQMDRDAWFNLDFYPQNSLSKAEAGMAGGSADRERVRVSLSGKSCLVYFRFIRIGEDKQIYLSFRCNFRLEIRMKGQKRVKNFSPMSIPPITVVY